MPVKVNPKSPGSKPFSGLSENGFHVAREKVVGDIARDDGAVAPQCFRVAIAHFGRDLEGDVDQLPEVAIAEFECLRQAELADSQDFNIR